MAAVTDANEAVPETGLNDPDKCSNVTETSPNASDEDLNDPETGLKKGAIGLLSNVVIGTASVAPAYSLAATLGFLALIPNMGDHAPGAMIAAFIPMLLIAVSYRQLNNADPDCGTTFAWVTRAMGPHLGWVNGWAIFLADVIVMASLADVAATYTYELFGWSYGTEHVWIVIAGSVLWIVLMTWICYRGITLSARLQQCLLSFEVMMLLVFSGVALAKAYAGHPAHSIPVEPSWFNPFGGGLNAMVDGVLLAVFIYWGWDSGVSLNEETSSPRKSPGLAAILSTILLVLIYVVVSCGAQSFHGLHFLAERASSEDVLSPLGHGVLGPVGFRLLILAILASAASSTQTTILPTARTTLSMARWGAIPKAFGKLHPRHRTPTVSTLGMGAVSIAWTVALLALNPNRHVLGDAITGLGFSIAFYYGFTGLACVIYFRRLLLRSWRSFLMVGVAPGLGALLLLAIFVKSLVNYGRVAESHSPPILGIPVPLLIGIGGLMIGVALMLVAMPFQRSYFSRRPELPDEERPRARRRRSSGDSQPSTGPPVGGP